MIPIQIVESFKMTFSDVPDVHLPWEVHVRNGLENQQHSQGSVIKEIYLYDRYVQGQHHKH